MAKKTVKSLRFQKRDGEILEAIYSYDGILADYQIKQLFFSPATMRAAQKRLEKLLDAGYIARPDRVHRAQLEGYTVYWLAQAGVEYVASLLSVTVSELSWRRPQSRWSETKHDIAINDFRIAMTLACHNHPDLKLVEWIGSREFWADHDTITFSIRRGTRVTKHERGIVPDGYFVIKEPGQNPSRFLLEIDRGTHPHTRIIKAKLHAGLAYIASEAYRVRFDYNAGRWLMVVNSEERMRTMQDHARRELGDNAWAFYFTTQALALSHNPLTDAIWFKGAETAPTVLFKGYENRTTTPA